MLCPVEAIWMTATTWVAAQVVANHPSANPWRQVGTRQCREPALRSSHCPTGMVFVPVPPDKILGVAGSNKG